MEVLTELQLELPDQGVPSSAIAPEEVTALGVVGLAAPTGVLQYLGNKPSWGSIG